MNEMHPEITAQSPPDEYVDVSIRINLPDYNHWRSVNFIMNYPYLSAALLLPALLGLYFLSVFLHLLFKFLR